MSEEKKEEDKVKNLSNDVFKLSLQLADHAKEFYKYKHDLELNKTLLISMIKRLDALEHPDLSPSLKAFQELRAKLNDASSS